MRENKCKQRGNEQEENGEVGSEDRSWEKRRKIESVRAGSIFQTRGRAWEEKECKRREAEAGTKKRRKDAEKNKRNWKKWEGVEKGGTTQDERGWN